jgi:hypothetical protein
MPAPRFAITALLLWLNVLLLGGPEANAQSRRYLAGGGWVEGGLVNADRRFAELPGVESCAGDSGAVDGGNGWRAGIGAHVEWPEIGVAGPVRIWLALRAGIARTALTLDSRERIGQVLDGLGNPAGLIVEYARDVAMTSIQLGARADVRFAKDASFGLFVGGDVDIPLSTSYHYLERIDSPAEAEFVEGGDERNRQEGMLPSPGFVPGYRAGLFGEVGMGKAAWLRLELAGSQGLRSILDGVDLRTSALFLTATMIWGLQGDSTPITPE